MADAAESGTNQLSVITSTAGQGSDQPWLCQGIGRWHAKVHSARGSCRVRSSAMLHSHTAHCSLMAPLATLHACALLSLLRCHASLVWRYLPDAHSFIFVLVHQTTMSQVRLLCAINFCLDFVRCSRRLWKGLTPLWGRQIPYTMMKFGKHGFLAHTAQAWHSHAWHATRIG